MSFVDYALERGPLVILKTGVYLVDGFSSPDTKRYRFEINDSENRSWPLIKVNPDSLWTVFSRLSEDKMEEAIAERADELVESVLEKEYRVLSSALSVRPPYVRLVRTALFEIGSYFIERTTDEVGRIVEGDEDAERQAVLEFLKSRVGCSDIEIDTSKIAEARSKLLRATSRNAGAILRERARNSLDVVGALGILYYEGVAYKLGPCPEGGARIRVHAEDKIYAPIGKLSASVIQQTSFGLSADNRTILEFHAKRLAAERLGELNIDKEEFGVVAAALRLKRGRRKADLDMGDWGIVLVPEHVKVYLKIPAYALRDWKRRGVHYHLFPACKVAIHVWPDDTSEPYVLGRGEGPFLSNDITVGKGTNMDICMGDAAEYGIAQTEPTEIAEYLDRARQVLLTGYRRGANADTGTLRMFREVTKSEIRRLGVPVTNE